MITRTLNANTEIQHERRYSTGTIAFNQLCMILDLPEENYRFKLKQEQPGETPELLPPGGCSTTRTTVQIIFSSELRSTAA